MSYPIWGWISWFQISRGWHVWSLLNGLRRLCFQPPGSSAGELNCTPSVSTGRNVTELSLRVVYCRYIWKDVHFSRSLWFCLTNFDMNQSEMQKQFNGTFSMIIAKQTEICIRIIRNLSLLTGTSKKTSTHLVLISILSLFLIEIRNEKLKLNHIEHLNWP